MATRRCSTCSINYPVDGADAKPLGSACDYCSERLDWFADIDPDGDWREKIAMLRWKGPSSTSPMYGGVTELHKFEAALESMIGVDDFLTDCGDGWRPKGNE